MAMYQAGLFGASPASELLAPVWRFTGGQPMVSDLVSATGWVALLIVIVRQIVPWRRQETISEAQFRSDLIRRISWLERQQVRHDAEKRLLIHKLRNVQSNFDSMLLMLEMNPDRVPEIVALIKKQRAAQMVAEAQEAAIIIKQAEEDAELQIDEFESTGGPVDEVR